MNRILTLFLCVITTAALADDTDKRQVLSVNELQRDHVLNEMRVLLSGTQAILAALAKEDMEAVAQYAKPLGMGMAHKAEDHLKGALPKEFMQLGMSVHQDFDKIAADATSLKNPKHTLQQLSESMNKCVGCHASYQLSTTASTVEKASEQRLDEVVERGSHVMPFDLEQTTHVFSKTDTGGIQQVIVKDPANTEQINLIRQHLTKISTEFQQGDFSNPVKIHGDSMAGLAELRKAKSGEISVVYKELPNGAEIDYSSDLPVLINAIHQFFDAQLSDHARHAVSGHSNHSTHHQ